MRKCFFLSIVMLLAPLAACAATDNISYTQASDYTQEDLAYSVTLTPSATTGSITLTLGSGNWNGNAKVQAGCWVQGNSGVATITGTPAAQTTIAATVTTGFANTNAIASGSWDLYCTSIYDSQARLGKYYYACGTETVTYAAVTYSTVQIGTQCWMGENLNLGTQVAGTTTMTDNDILEKHCYANTEANCTNEGGLYQWDEAMDYVETAGTQGICPEGWHIPTDAEWTTLTTYLGTDEGDKLKTAADCVNMNYCGTSGFEGLLAGYRSTGGSLADRGSYGAFWSSSVSGSGAWYRDLDSDVATVTRNAYDQAVGFSVRCLKD